MGWKLFLIAQLLIIFVLIKIVFVILESCDVLWKHIFNLDASAAASEFCEWFQAEIDAYTPHPKYQVRSSLINPHGFLLLVLLLSLIDIFFLKAPEQFRPNQHLSNKGIKENKFSENCIDRLLAYSTTYYYVTSVTED